MPMEIGTNLFKIGQRPSLQSTMLATYRRRWTQVPRTCAMGAQSSGPPMKPCSRTTSCRRVAWRLAAAGELPLPPVADVPGAAVRVQAKLYSPSAVAMAVACELVTAVVQAAASSPLLRRAATSKLAAASCAACTLMLPPAGSGVARSVANQRLVPRPCASGGSGAAYVANTSV